MTELNTDLSFLLWRVFVSHSDLQQHQWYNERTHTHTHTVLHSYIYIYINIYNCTFTTFYIYTLGAFCHVNSCVLPTNTGFLCFHGGLSVFHSFLLKWFLLHCSSIHRSSPSLFTVSHLLVLHENYKSAVGDTRCHVFKQLKSKKSVREKRDDAAAPNTCKWKVSRRDNGAGGGRRRRTHTHVGRAAA